MVKILCITVKKQKNRPLNEKCVNTCPRIFVFSPIKSVGNDFIPQHFRRAFKKLCAQLITAIHNYPQLFTKKKVAKKKERQHHGGYLFFSNFNTLKSKPYTKISTPASVTFLNELTRLTNQII